jgi:hypothetical protein
VSLQVGVLLRPVSNMLVSFLLWILKLMLQAGMNARQDKPRSAAMLKCRRHRGQSSNSIGLSFNLLYTINGVYLGCCLYMQRAAACCGQ